MKNLFNGKVNVYYGQFYLVSTLIEMDSSYDPLNSAFLNQLNGLCGAAERGTLFLLTGLHTGHVNLTITLHDSEPPIDDTWQEIVEVSLQIMSPNVLLTEMLGNTLPVTLPEGCYRVRYYANYMDEGHFADTILENEETVDSYALTFWPAPTKPDCIIKQTSETAAYWHHWVRELANQDSLEP